MKFGETVGLILILGLLTAPGIGLLAVGGHRLEAQRSFLRDAQLTTGHVVAVDFLRAGEDSSIYTVSIEYPVPGGSPRRFSIEAGSQYTIGQAVEVAYIASRPEETRLGGFKALWENALIFTVVGFFWTALGLFFLYAILRVQRGTK